LASRINGTSGVNYRARGFAACIDRTGKLACERCGYDVNLYGLVVHHKDSDRRNDAPDNLEVLCATCHAIEHNDGSASFKSDFNLALLLLKRA
jgi:predicted HNH restriction endonuclease